MRATCIAVAMALSRQRPAQIRAGVRHSAPRIAGLPRWKSTRPEHLLPYEGRDGHSSELEGYTIRAKGKQRERPSTQDRTELIEAVLLDTERGVEESKAWEETSARYPDMKTKQISLVTLLDEVIRKMNKAQARLSGSEVLMLHATILKADGRLGDLRRFQRSAVAYNHMLKYAYRLRDARALKHIAREALDWKHNHMARAQLNRRRPRFIHPRVAAAEDLSRLIRNLFVSLNVEQGVRIMDQRKYSTSGTQLPTSKARLQPGDDAVVVSKMLRQRLSAFRFARDDEGNPYIEMSSAASRSSYPLTHQPSRIRWLNRMVARGQLGKISARLAVDGARKIEPPLLSAPETSKEATTPPEHPTSLALVPPSVPAASAQKDMTEDARIAEVKGRGGLVEILSDRRGSQLQSRQMEAIGESFARWQDQLMRRVKAQEKVAGLFERFQLDPSSSIPRTTEAVQRVVPTWLVLTLLRLQIERGDIRRAERVLEVYLQSLAVLYKDQKLSEIIPVQAARVHAITAPLTPPNGSSLLNGLLRTHLNSGAKDCFEAMVLAVHKWAFQAKRFTQCVLMKRISRDDLPFIPKYAGCLIPNQETVLILLEGLERRHQRYSLGKALVEQMWYRWGIVGLRDERVSEALVEPQRHQALEIPLQAFTRLLKWAKKEVRDDRRRKKITEVIELERRWREKTSQSTFRGASVEDKLAWKRAVRGVEMEAQWDEQEEQPPTLYFTRNH